LVENKDIEFLKPYTNNPRDNSASIEKVAASIREFGFLQPIVCDGKGVIIAGHTRYCAARRLGLKRVPVLVAEDLTPAQARAYRLADNKVSESSKWIESMLGEELAALSVEMKEFNPADFGFEADSAEARHKRMWHKMEKRCNLVMEPQLREKNGISYVSFYKTTEEGRTYEDIKADPVAAQLMADNLTDYLERSLGKLEKGDWCLATTPRRRHRKGFHFATEVCELSADSLHISFRKDIAEAKNRTRINPVFSVNYNPPEHNVILFDDIISTGSTLKAVRDLLIERKHAVYCVVGIRNQ